MTPLPPRPRKSPPYRVQRSRRKGSRLPAGAVCVSRPSKYGNPFPASQFGGDKALAVRAYRAWLLNTVAGETVVRVARVELRGKVLACWCKVGEACHADVLLEFANAPEPKKGGAP